MSSLQKKLQTPLGDIYIVASAQGLTQLSWEKHSIPMMADSEKKPATLILNETEKQLYEYLAGERKVFELPIYVNGTDFQQQVWASLMRIPYGKTWSYKELAKSINNQNACRAVGTANGRNPLAIIIPCHRVINANGSLGGYSSGLPRKIALLTLEGAPTETTHR